MVRTSLAVLDTQSLGIKIYYLSILIYPVLKLLCQIFLCTCLFGQSSAVYAGEPVFRYLDNGDFDRLDLYLADHDINAVYGDTAATFLVYSILYNKNSVTQYLINKGADVNFFVNGKSPLMHAAMKGNKKKAALLVSRQAEINALDTALNTCLIFAARHGDLKTVKYLVRNGAALNHKNKNNYTAYDESVRYYNIEVSKYLRNEYLKNLPDFHDGPYVSWKGRQKIKAFYMIHDSARHRTYKQTASFRAESSPFLMKGFSQDSLEYLVSKYREIPDDQIQGVEQIMVIGDIHGGYDSLLVFLRNNKVIDPKLNWAWGKGHLVFLGDIFDRGDKVTEALWLIYRLDGQAAAAGGAVHLILGNHEIMVMNHDETYVADKYRLMSEKINISYGNLFSHQTILGQWLRSKNTILKINDHLFVHAGLSFDFVEVGCTMQDINKHVRFFLKNPYRESHGEITRESIMGKSGPFWYRGYLEDNHEYKHLPEENLSKILSAYQANRIFIGHTNVPQITPLYQSRVYAMDVPFYSNEVEMQGIAIQNDVLYLVNSSGNKNEFR